MPVFIVKLIQKINQDDCFGLSAELAYHMVLSLIPMLVFTTAMIGVLGAQEEIYALLIDVIKTVAPVHATKLLIDTMNTIVESSSANITALGFVGMLFSALGVSNVLVKGLQRLYGLSGQKFPFWYVPYLMVLIFLSFGTIMILSAYLVIFGKLAIYWFSSQLNIDPGWLFWLPALRWLIVFIAIAWGVAYTYTLILRPKITRVSWKKACPGSLFFVISWLSTSLLFSLYVERLNQFNPIYGTLGALIILVSWLYYSSLVFFIGGAITALNVETTDKDSKDLLPVS